MQAPQRGEADNQAGGETSTDLGGTAFGIERFEQLGQHIEHSKIPFLLELDVSVWIMPPILAQEPADFPVALTENFP